MMLSRISSGRRLIRSGPRGVLGCSWPRRHPASSLLFFLLALASIAAPPHHASSTANGALGGTVQSMIRNFVEKSRKPSCFETLTKTPLQASRRAPSIYLQDDHPPARRVAPCLRDPLILADSPFHGHLAPRLRGGEILIFNSEFASLSVFDIEFANLSIFNPAHANCFTSRDF